MKLLVNGWWHDLKTKICLRGNKWHIYFGCIFVLYFLFAGFSNVVKLMISVCLYCFLGSKLCCLSTYANCFSVNYHRKNSCPDQIKKGFLFNWKWEMMPTFLFRFLFLFLSFWLFGSSKLIFTWLKTSRLLWQLWKGVQSAKDCSPITNRFLNE